LDKSAFRRRLIAVLSRLSHLIAGKECCFNFANIYTVVLEKLTKFVVRHMFMTRFNLNFCGTWNAY